MKKKYLKGITSVVSSALLFSTISTAIPSYVNAETTNIGNENEELLSTPLGEVEELNQDQLINELIESDIKLRVPSSLSLEDFESFEDIPKELLNQIIILKKKSFIYLNHI